MMDFAKLLEPYNENGRSVEGQIAWLRKRGYPPHIVEEAITSLFNELDAGILFTDGHKLDQRLREIANELMKVENVLLATRARKNLEELAADLRGAEPIKKNGFAKRLWKRLTEPI